MPGRVGGAGGGQDTVCSEVRPAVSPPQKKAAKLGCFGFKISGGNREFLKGNVKKKKKWKMGEENKLLSKSFYVKIKFLKKREREKNKVS